MMIISYSDRKYRYVRNQVCIHLCTYVELTATVTENYKKVYEIWRQRNPECRMYKDAKKLINQRNYIMKHNKITEMEVEEIRRELQESQRSHQEEREEEEEEEELEHSWTIRDGEQKLDAASTTEEETEIYQQRNQIHK